MTVTVQLICNANCGRFRSSDLRRLGSSAMRGDSLAGSRREEAVGLEMFYEDALLCDMVKMVGAVVGVFEKCCMSICEMITWYYGTHVQSGKLLRFLIQVDADDSRHGLSHHELTAHSRGVQPAKVVATSTKASFRQPIAPADGMESRGVRKNKNERFECRDEKRPFSRFCPNVPTSMVSHCPRLVIVRRTAAVPDGCNRVAFGGRSTSMNSRGRWESRHGKKRHDARLQRPSAGYLPFLSRFWLLGLDTVQWVRITQWIYAQRAAARGASRSLELAGKCPEVPIYDRDDIRCHPKRNIFGQGAEGKGAILCPQG
ncbi:hypothetical protein BJV78DRAFT_1157331 [Lactifluus subvellereus]|nr:hypothetical protein BJV78DRAFT_1157331 [Lactifluus subvellereus]